MHTNRKSVVISNVVCVCCCLGQERKIKHCEKRYPMHWHHFEFTCDNFSIIVLIALCSTMESFGETPHDGTHFFAAVVCKLKCTQNHGNKSSRRITVGWTNVASIAIIAIVFSIRNKRFSSVKWATSVSLSCSSDCDIDGDKPHLIGIKILFVHTISNQAIVRSLAHSLA